MNSMRRSLSQKDYEESNFSIRYTAFKISLEKYINAGKEKLRKMEDRGWNRSQLHMKDYIAFSHVIDCYIDLYNREPKNDSVQKVIFRISEGKWFAVSELPLHSFFHLGVETRIFNY